MIAAVQRPPEQRLLESFADACLAPKMRTMLEFAEAEFVHPKGKFANQLFRRERQPYSGLLLAELDGCRTPKWRRRAILGPTQSGKTVTSYVLPTLWHVFERGENVICGVPMLDMAADKWEDDLKPAIESSRYRDLLPRSGPGSRGGTPTTITFRNGRWIRFMGAGGGPQQRSGKETRVLIMTEVDKYDPPGEPVGVEGSKFDQLEGRLRSWGLHAIVYMECTATNTDGRIWQEYKNGTASRIICPCPHCGHWVSPEREDLFGWQDTETKLAAGRGAYFACPSCSGRIGEQQRLEMNLAGRLLHRGQEVTETGEIVGVPAETDTFGFRSGAFNNLFTPIEQLGQEDWTASRDDNKANAETVRKQQAWAVPVEPDRAEAIELTKAIVRGSDPRYGGRCNDLDRGIVPDDTQCVTVHVDPGWSTYRETFWWDVVAHCGPAPHRLHLANYDVFPARLATIRDEDHVRRCLDAVRNTLLDNPPKDSSGRPVPIPIKTVDCSGAMTDVVCEFVAMYAHEGWRATKGLGSSEDANRNRQYMHPTKCTDTVRVYPFMDRWYESLQVLKNGASIWVINVDVDTYKLRVHNAFALPPRCDDDSPRPGSVTLWGKEPNLHRVVADHVLAERFEADFKRGRGEKKRWVKHEKENHLLDCLTNNLAAVGMAMIGQSPTETRPAILSTGIRRPTNRTW